MTAKCTVGDPLSEHLSHVGPEGFRGIQSESFVALLVKEEQVSCARAIHLYVLEVPQGGIAF